MLILVPFVARLTCGARLRDFGLSFDGWWRQAAVGVVATLIAAPPVNAIQFLATKIWTPQPHPVQEMMLKEFSVGRRRAGDRDGGHPGPDVRGTGVPRFAAKLARGSARPQRRRPADPVVVDELRPTAPDGPARLRPSPGSVEPELEPDRPYEAAARLDGFASGRRRRAAPGSPSC